MIFLVLYNLHSLKGKNHLGKNSYQALCGNTDVEWMGGEIEIHQDGKYIIDDVRMPTSEIEKMYCNKCLQKANP